MYKTSFILSMNRKVHFNKQDYLNWWFQDVSDLLDHSTSELSDKLCRIGDRIVFKLVQWTRRLPFYTEIPVELHTRLLTNKWHELLVLTTSAYQVDTQRLHNIYSVSTISIQYLLCI